MTATVDVSIIIVNWNSTNYVRACVASIIEHTRRVRYEIIVVDSGSFDGCGEMLSALYPQVRFVQCAHNVGFGRANNIGACQARAATLLLLNPDTELRSDAVSALNEKLAELPLAGVIGCRLLNSDGSLQGTCVQPFPTILNQVFESRVLERRFKDHRWWKTPVALEGVEHEESVEVIAGACMMMKRSVFRALGGFSSDYFMYAEDVDLCFRSREAGHVNYYVPGIGVVHHGGGSTQIEHRRFSVVMMRESLNRFLTHTRGLAYGNAYRAAMTATALARVALIALYVPVAMAKGRQRACRASLRKWISILRWGLGLERWVCRYRTAGANADIRP